MPSRNAKNSQTLARQVIAYLNDLDGRSVSDSLSLKNLWAQFTAHLANRNPHGKNFWRGEWVQQQYFAFDQVLDDAWLMIANKDTTDRAAPIPFAAAEWTIPDAPIWTPASYTGTVYSGMIIIIPADTMYAISEIRIWIADVSPNANYRTIFQNILTGAFTYGQAIKGDVLTVPGWLEINIANEIIVGGEQFAVVLQSWNTAGTTDYNHPWVYTGTSQTNADPGLGNWNRDNQHSILRISNTDDDGTDRTAELTNAIENTIIRCAEEGNLNNFWEYVVQADTAEVGFHTYNVVLQDVGGAGVGIGQRCQLYFEVPIAASTDYVLLTDGYLAQPDLDGYISFDDYEGGTTNNNAYGIDVKFQQYAESPDWDIQAFSG